MIEEWRCDYNQARPHSALSYLNARGVYSTVSTLRQSWSGARGFKRRPLAPPHPRCGEKHRWTKNEGQVRIVPKNATSRQDY